MAIPAVTLPPGLLIYIEISFSPSDFFHFQPQWSHFIESLGDSFNIDKVSIKNSVFVYDDPVYTSFTTKIMLDNVPLHFSQKQNISTVKIHSPQLMQIQMELEKKIKDQDAKFEKYSMV